MPQVHDGARRPRRVREMADIRDDDLLDVEEVGNRDQVEDEVHQERHVQRTLSQRQCVGHG